MSDKGQFEFFPHNPSGNIDIQIPGWAIQKTRLNQYISHFTEADRLGWINEALIRAGHQPEPVVIDIFSENDAIRGFKEQYAKDKPLKGLSVSMDSVEGLPYTPKDKAMGIDHLQGDITVKQTIQDIYNWLNGKKAHLVFQRGYAALHYIPNREQFYRVAIGTIWDILDPGGGMAMIQTPSRKNLEKNGIRINDWLLQLNSAGVQYQFQPTHIADLPKEPLFGILLLKKTSPSQLLPDITNL